MMAERAYASIRQLGWYRGSTPSLEDGVFLRLFPNKVQRRGERLWSTRGYEAESGFVSCDGKDGNEA